MLKRASIFIGSALALTALPVFAGYQFKVPSQGLVSRSAAPEVTPPAPPPITLALSATTPTVGRQTLPYSYSLATLLAVTGDASFDPAAVTWSLTGALPANLTFSNGVISGTPSVVTMPGSLIEVQANYKGQTATQSYTVKVAPLDTLLLNMGSGGGTANLTDLAGHTVTKGSTWVASATQAKFGTSSGNFTRFSELTVPYSSDFQFDGDFTIEGWANVSSTYANWQLSNGADTGVGGPLAPIIGHGNPFSGGAAPLSSASNFDFGINTSTKEIYFARRTGAGQTGKVVSVSSPISFSYNTWHHYAVSRAGSTLYFAFDGAIVGTNTLAGPLNVASSLPVTIGRTRGGDDQLFNWLNGYLQDVRVTKGYARYVTPFTPPGAMTLYD